MKLHLLILAIIILPSAFAVSIAVVPSSQTITAGETFTADIVLDNNETIWGFSFKLHEGIASDIELLSAEPQPRIEGGLNSAAENGNKVTVFSAFAGTTPGIAEGTGAVYKLVYSVPESVPAGQHFLDPQELYVSNSQGASIQATITGATINVQSSEQGYMGLWLPEVSTKTGKIVEVTLCATNTYTTKTLKGIEAVITHNSAIAEVQTVQVIEGAGSSSIKKSSTQITTIGAAVKDADCDKNSGKAIAKITYEGVSAGTTTLTFSAVELLDDKGQLFSLQTTNTNGKISVTSQSSGSSGSGSGGGGSKSTTKDVCRNCGQYTCCGPTLAHVNYLCKRAGATTNCKLNQPVQQTPSRFFEAIPAQEEITTQTVQEPEQKPKQEPQLQIPQRATPEPRAITRLIWAMIVVILVIAIAVYLSTKLKSAKPVRIMPKTEVKESRGEAVTIIQRRLRKK